MCVLFQWLRRVDSANGASNGTVRVGDERYVVLTGAYNGVLVARHDGTYMSRLTIHNATERQTGLYMCSATNTDGYLSAYLRVMPPSLSSFLIIKLRKLLCTQHRSVAKNVGCFQRRLFVCLRLNTITSERVNIGYDETWG